MGEASWGTRVPYWLFSVLFWGLRAPSPRRNLGVFGPPPLAVCAAPANLAVLGSPPLAVVTAGTAWARVPTLAFMKPA